MNINIFAHGAILSTFSIHISKLMLKTWRYCR